jgi:predicted nucleic acid-binding protein
VRAAVRLAENHKLAMADAIILQTAISCDATLFTQDAAFKGLLSVAYIEK